MPRKYPKLIYQMIYDDVRAEVGNKISYMGIFRGDIILPIPSVLPKLCFHLVFTGIKDGDRCTFQFLDPENKELAKITPDAFKIPKKVPIRMFVMDVMVGGLNITQEGDYRVLIAFGKEDKAKQDFTVRFKKKSK